LIIKVKGFLTYRDVIGQREIEQSDDSRITLIDFIHVLASELGGDHAQALYDAERGTVGQSVAIMLNGRHYNHLPDKLDTVLKDQDEVSVFPPGAGG
jgi:MoaD family protein